jgi:hypothetical protein
VTAWCHTWANLLFLAQSPLPTQFFRSNRNLQERCQQSAHISTRSDQTPPSPIYSRSLAWSIQRHACCESWGLRICSQYMLLAGSPWSGNNREPNADWFPTCQVKLSSTTIRTTFQHANRGWVGLCRGPGSTAGLLCCRQVPHRAFPGSPKRVPSPHGVHRALPRVHLAPPQAVCLFSLRKRNRPRAHVIDPYFPPLQLTSICQQLTFRSFFHLPFALPQVLAPL